MSIPARSSLEGSVSQSEGVSRSPLDTARSRTRTRQAVRHVRWWIAMKSALRAPRRLVQEKHLLISPYISLSSLILEFFEFFGQMIE